MKHLCILPWISIEAGSQGDLRPCCLAVDPIRDDKNKPMNLKTSTLTDGFTSNYMKDLREQFLRGEKPQTCKRCWDEEDAGRSSKRINSTYRLENLELQEKLTFLDLKLGNICNLKCRICGSYSSSKWAQEERAINPSDKNPKNNLKNGQWPRTNTKFWEDLSDILDGITYFEFTGGEPFLIDEHFDILQQAVDLGYAKNIAIHYNTNTTTVPDRGLELWPEFKRVEIALSIDDIGDRFEYQRYGTNWQETLANLNTFRELRSKSQNIELQLCATVNALNIYYLDELAMWAEQQSFDFIHFNMLHDAAWFNIKNLNQVAKNLIVQKFSALQIPYKNDINKLITFMIQGDGSDCSDLIRVLKRSDEQRNQHYADSHPEMAKAIGYEKT